MKKTALYLILSTWLVSCTKPIDYTIPNPGEKLVVQCILFNDVQTVAAISSSRHSLSSRSPFLLSGAKAVLIENGSRVDSFNEAQNVLSYYHIARMPVEGASYTIKISAPNTPHLAPIEAKTTMPYEANPYATRIDLSTHTASFYLNDSAHTTDYYRIRVLDHPRDDNGYFFATTQPEMEIFNAYPDIFGDGRATGESAFISDRSFNGRQKKFTVHLSVNEEDAGDQQYFLEVLRVNEDFYKYEKSLAASDITGENPFQEPIQVFSNVENGYGILLAGARSLTTMEFFYSSPE